MTTVFVIKNLPKIILAILLLGLCFVSLLAQLDLSTGVSGTIETPMPTPTDTPTPIPVPTHMPTSNPPPDPSYTTDYCGRVGAIAPNNPFHGWPTDHPIYQNWAYMTTSFCDPTYPFTWEHEGVDFGWHLGTNVVATADATVQQMGYDTNLGYLVILCNNGFCARYGHMRSLDGGIALGGTVRRGQRIGDVGNTGAYTTGPHLHYDIYNSSGFIDPAPTIH